VTAAYYLPECLDRADTMLGHVGERHRRDLAAVAARVIVRAFRRATLGPLGYPR
jgi:hypothetical protein